MRWYQEWYVLLCRRFPWWVFLPQGKLGGKPSCRTEIVVLNYYHGDKANCTIAHLDHRQDVRKDFPADLLRKRKIKPLGSFWLKVWSDGHVLSGDIVLRDNMDILSDADRESLQRKYYPEHFGTEAAVVV